MLLSATSCQLINGDFENGAISLQSEAVQHWNLGKRQIGGNGVYCRRQPRYQTRPSPSQWRSQSRMMTCADSSRAACVRRRVWPHQSCCPYRQCRGWPRLAAVSRSLQADRFSFCLAARQNESMCAAFVNKAMHLGTCVGLDHWQWITSLAQSSRLGSRARRRRRPHVSRRPSWHLPEIKYGLG